MSRQNGPWQINDVTMGYENPWIRVEHNDVKRPDGSDGIYGIVRFANLATGVLPLFEDGTTMLVGQHRFAFDAYSWELPEGGCPKGEAPEVAALRELREETGLTAEHILPLGEAQLSNSVTDEYAYYYLAWGLEAGKAAPDADEILEQRRIPLSVLIAEILAGEVTDALTILMVERAVLKAQLALLPERPRDLILSALKGLPGVST